ncbi:MAG: efflux RND transporter permease subunit [Cyclobacteriaceae bacterium]|nr:efflux RND transporter permease subunit [Cyclobacteriaceae bacterium]
MISAIRSIVELFVRNHILANIIIAVTLIGGIIAFLNTNKSFFPLRKSNTISIQVVYPGASPEEMEEGVTQKVEEAIDNIPGVDEITSNSSENSARISVKILETYDIDEIYTEVKNAVDGINGFPVSAEKPIITKMKPQTTAMWLGLRGDNVELNTLKKYGEDVRDDMLASGVISQVSLVGFNPLEISIELEENVLRQYNLTFDQVAAAVRMNNRDISAGAIKSTTEEILIRSKAKEKDADLIGEIVIRSNPDGSNLLLRDVATIREQFTEAPSKWRLNGEQAAFIRVDKLEEEDLQEIATFVENYVQEYNTRYNGIQLELAFNFMDTLKQRLDMLTTNGLVGLALVLVSLGLFLSLRLSFWVAWGIPSSFLGMFIVGSFFGLTINMISLFGMILVIGILVDDGIVIAENIYTHFERTKNPVKAAIEGTMEVVPAVFTSVSTTIVAFSPLFILTGGFEFLKDMAFVVVASLAFSLVEAFFVLPAHLSSRKVLSARQEGTRSYKIRKVLNGGVDFMRYKIYGRMLKLTMRYKVISVCFIIALFPLMAGLFGGGFIKATFFPQVPFPNFQIDIAFKPGVTETKTEKYVERFEDIVWEVNDEFKEQLQDTVDFIKFTFSSVGFNQGPNGEQGGHAGGVQVFYRELDGTGINSYDLINKIRAKVGEVPEAERLIIGGQNRFGKPVSVRLLGNNYDELQGAMKFLKEELAKIDALKDIEDNVKIGRREMLFELKPNAYAMGLTHNDITRQIRQGFFGEEVQRLQKGIDEVRVWVRYPKKDRINMGQIENMKVKTVSGGEYPLSQLASYEIERGVSSIAHYDAKRAVTVEAELVDPFDEVPPILKDIRENIVPAMLVTYPSVKVDYGGQARESARAQKEISLFFGGAFFIMFIIIMINFRSFYQAILIIMMIPLGWIGASIGHGIHEHPVSLLSSWGMIALSGVIINDAVVFLAKFNSLVKEGLTVYEAAYQAGMARFRAIMLTSITTVVGLFPLIIEKSFQAQFLIPMAISVAYGVLIGTFFILLFFPVFILVFNDVRRYAKWLWDGGPKPTPEEVERVTIDLHKHEKFDEPQPIAAINSN